MHSCPLLTHCMRSPNARNTVAMGRELDLKKLGVRLNELLLLYASDIVTIVLTLTSAAVILPNAGAWFGSSQVGSLHSCSQQQSCVSSMHS